jgi:hypothetical protein
MLTTTGKSLGAPLTELYRWGERNAEVFGANVDAHPLARLEPGGA